MSETPDIDVLVITALKEELDALLKVEQDSGAPWVRVDDDPPYHTASFEGRRGSFTVAAARATTMGRVAAAALATDLIVRLSPRCAAMCGVCAGRSEDTDLGDVIIADRVFAYNEGKLKPGQFQGDLRNYFPPDRWIRVAQDLEGAAEGFWGYAEPDAEAGQWWFLEQLLAEREPTELGAIDRYFPDERRASELLRMRERGHVSLRQARFVLENEGREHIQEYRTMHGTKATSLPFHIHVAPIGSGDYVVGDSELWKRMPERGMRKTLGLEMEAAAVGRIAHERELPFVVIKGVMDHADSFKTDRCKQFAARASAEVLCGFLRKVVGLAASTKGEVRVSEESTDLDAELSMLRRDFEAAGEESEVVRAQILGRRRQHRDGPLLAPGDVLSGRYRLLEKVGSGGFATVWKAFDRNEDELVAIKVLHGQWSQDRSKLARFFSGARRMSTLRHEAIVEMRQEPQRHGHHYFFVMCWLAGGDLEKAVVERRLDLELGLRVVARVARALAYAHEQGVVHRDVKPANIMLDEQGRGCITDFDLARAKDSTQGTRTGGLGTFVYAAPEQHQDASRVDARADVYGVGMCALFTFAEKDPPLLPALTRPTLFDELDCSDQLREVLRRAVSYEVNERTLGCDELADALEAEIELLEFAARPDQQARVMLDDPAPGPGASGLGLAHHPNPINPPQETQQIGGIDQRPVATGSRRAPAMDQSSNLARERCVILRINIGEEHHHWVTDDEARHVAQELMDDPDPRCLTLERGLDRRKITPRQWRALARALDKLVDEAAAVEGPARYMVVGRAFLPVFAYLGTRMIRMGGPIHFANLHEGRWEFYGPPNEGPAGGRDDFRIERPNQTKQKGRLALSIRTSREYSDHEDSLAKLATTEGVELLEAYSIIHTKSKSASPLSPAELPVILRHIDDALEWMSNETSNTDGLVVSLAGPAWIAFWIGHRLNPTVWGRVDFPNFVSGQGYSRALSAPMSRAPWFADKAKLLVLTAEPLDLARTQASHSFDAIQSALESKLGRGGERFDIRLVSAAQFPRFIEEIEEFEPDILHLHMHGSQTGDLAFEDERGETHRVSAANLVARLVRARWKPSLILLSVPYSASVLAPQLRETAECVIAMEGTAETRSVVAFAKFFYTSLVQGNTLLRALEQGKVGAGIDRVEEYCAYGVNAKDIVLFPRTGRGHAEQFRGKTGTVKAQEIVARDRAVTVVKIAAPPRGQLPRKRTRGQSSLELELKVTTPIYGGAPIPREADAVDIIRPASVRGQLRFWWRALHAQDCESTRDLYLAESRLWGGPTVKGVEDIGRSPVELRVDILHKSEIVRVDVTGAEAYALFPGRRQQDGTPAARIRQQGTRFKLRLRFPSKHEHVIRDTLRAWMLFGGYGGRTRRGLGSLTVLGDTTQWLPAQPSVAAINKIFGRDIFAQPKVSAGVTPLLAGARLFSSFQDLNAWGAWSAAVGWLLEFRQGSENNGARRPGADSRPSISNWPEADKVRHLSEAALPWAHSPRHNEFPAWPRAGFGLPIIGQFQGQSRNDKRWEDEDPPRTEPRDFRIGWQQDGKLHERLASPVVLKPLALATSGGRERFNPIALWLNRAYPDGELVLLRDKNTVVPNSAVPFDRFLAPGDAVFFDGLAGKSNLQDAFFAWLDRHGRPQQRQQRPQRGKRRGRR